MTESAPAVETGARPASWVFDGLLGIGVTLVVSLFIAADIDGADPDGWAYLWAVGLGAIMLVRRRYPMIVVMLSAAAVLAYYASGYPAIGVAVPLAAAVFSAAEYGRTRASIVVSVAILTISVGYRLAIGQDPGVVVGYELPGHALLFAGAIAFGDSVRSRRELRQKSSQIAALTVERYAREAEKYAMSDRLSIARELHDSVGHAMTVVTLHTQIAEEALDSDKLSEADGAAAREALAIIANTTSATFEDVRRTVANLRKEDGAGRPAMRIEDLGSAIFPAKQAGLDVRAHVAVRSLPPAVEAAVFRIVQESITNVVRHSDAEHVDVRIRQTDDGVDVSVVNDSRSGALDPADIPGRTGTGLEGMRERAPLLGGTFSASPQDAGFAVRASFPLTVAP